MASAPQLYRRYARQVELAYLDFNPVVYAYQLGAAETLDEAYVGTHPMFQVPRLRHYRSPGIRARRLGITTESRRGQTWLFYDPQDFWTTVAATGTLTVVNAPLAAGDTITINGVVLVGAAGARTPGNNDFDASLANVNLIAAEIEDAINDPLNGFAATVTAAANMAIVTLTAVAPGSPGNAIALASLTVPAGGITLSGGALTGGYTMPPDMAMSFVRTSEVLADGTVGPEGPIFIIPPPTWGSSPHALMTFQGNAPNVAGIPSLLPPPDAMHFILPRLADNIVVSNLDAATNLYVSFGAGFPEVLVPWGTTAPFHMAATSEFYLRGDGATALFNIHCSMEGAML